MTDLIKRLKRVNAALTTGALALVALSACSEQQFAVEQGSESFGQQVTYNTEVDVLWVVDTSTSMGKHQDLVANQVSSFIDGLNATGLDYNIGVTTMDMSGSGARGRLLAQGGTPLILKKNTPNLKSVLASRLRAGEGGSPVERGLEAMLAALDASKSGGYNEGFLRENSLLSVIFLTDEEDQSSASVDYVAELDRMKPVLPWGDRSWLAHFMGVMPTDPSCKTSEWGFSSPGLKYLNLVTASEGASESICGADFSRALTNVRSRVLEMVTEFPLDRPPVIDSIVVMVDGVEVPRNSVNGWSYRAAVNAIRFHGTAIPKAGARIKVTFDPEGLK